MSSFAWNRCPASPEYARLRYEIRKVGGEQRRQRQEFFAVADDIEERSDALIEFLEKHLHRASRNHTLLTICKLLS